MVISALDKFPEDKPYFFLRTSVKAPFQVKDIQMKVLKAVAAVTSVNQTGASHECGRSLLFRWRVFPVEHFPTGL